VPGGARIKGAAMQQQVRQLGLRPPACHRAAGPLRGAGDPGGAPIIFLPAYSDSWFSYSRVLSLLSVRYHAYVPLPEMFFHAGGLADLGPAARPRNAAGAQLLPIQHVQVDVQPPAGSSCRDVLGGLAAAISGVLVVHLRGHRWAPGQPRREPRQAPAPLPAARGSGPMMG
jgi:hypothetical protein